MIRVIVFIISTFLLISCSLKNGFIEANNFYNKNKDKDIKILLNLMIISRGDHGKGLQKIQVNRKNESPLTIPIFDDTDSTKLLDSVYFDIELFAKINNVDKSHAFNYTKAFSDSVVRVYKTLCVISAKSYPELGSFIIFQITPKDEVIYLESIKKVHHKYWNDFFKKAHKFDEYWYYRKIE